MASTKKVIYAAIGANFAIAVSKFIGAAISGSSAMISEGIHSLVDTGNGGLILLGMRRAQRPPDKQHPYGYGKSLYFYTLIVAILIFGVGGGISIYEGLLHALHAPAHAEPSTYTLAGITFTGLMLNTVILGAAICFELYAWVLAYKEMRRLQRPGETMMQTVRRSKDPATYTVLFEDTAAVAGLVVALVGIYLAHWLDAPFIDGLASVFIGLILCGVASMLIWESKGLLLGEAADPGSEAAVRQLVERDADVESVARILTMHMGPTTIILALEVAFRRGLSSSEIEAAVDRVERAIYDAHPEMRHIFIEAEDEASRRRDGRLREGRRAAEEEGV